MRRVGVILGLGVWLGWAASAYAAENPGVPAASPPVTAEQWQARGGDHILLYRPALAARAMAEIPAGRLANIPALLQVLERLRPLAVLHPGHLRARLHPWEPESVYEPSDDELLLSLAGDRIGRWLQQAPPGELEKVASENPALIPGVTYPHIDIVRIEMAGTGPALLANPPTPRHLGLPQPAPDT